MKKVVVFLLAVVLILSFTACDTSNSTDVEDDSETEGNAASTDVEDDSTAEEGSSSTDTSETDAMDFTGRSIVMGAWGGTFAEACLTAYAEPFMELTGCEIIIEEYGTDVVAKVISQKEQDMAGFDLISGCGALDQIAVMSANDAVLELDYSMLPNSEYVPDGAKFDYAVGQYVISTNLAWNVDVYGDDPPDTLEKFFDVENYPGNRGLVGFSPTGLLEQALLADGVAKEDLYPLDLDRAFAMLDKVKPYVTKWWTSGAEIRQSLADGEVDCGIFWGGSLIEGMMKEGMENIEMAHAGASLITDCLAIPSTCQDVELTYAFLNYIMSGEAAAKWAELKYYGPTTSLAADLIPEDLSKYFTSSPENIDEGFWCDVPYWTENFESITEDFLLWIAS